MKQKNLFIAAAALLLVLFIGGAWVYKSQLAEQAAQTAARNRESLERSHAPRFGNPGAPVHIVEFFDPACGTCRDFYPMVKAMMAANPGKIKLSLRYAPFHPGSDKVVKALEAARRQGLLQQSLEALFIAQDSWVINHSAQVAKIWGPLAALGLDMQRLQADMNAPEVAQIIAQDLADAKTLNVTMTPEFFVNGKPLPKFGFDELKKLVDEALVATAVNPGTGK
ncbi:MAG: DsbA family protein [Rhodoferax sp.]|nr:DsbA family protein [Rhodoferax sp.]